MNKRGITYVVCSGLLAGLLVSVVMTFLDWRLNPGGIFHSTTGTDWAIVRATAWTWFWPVALLVAAIALPVVWFLLRRSGRV
ncbi:MAG: hypothetical protein WBN32_07745 [Woeseia sp.]